MKCKNVCVCVCARAILTLDLKVLHNFLSLSLSLFPPDAPPPPPEISEFHILSLDGKVWIFEANSPEVGMICRLSGGQ